ncbi:TetR/AcrR family transcriptional regulator [Streptomyces sp. NPDC004267]|uniref:TetR/AcrR family transcriptional regulator n=1 Tax=Streptomyces sp. NPDC004267 TaxID=3364694 RepID=UPI00367E62FC
MKDRKTTILEAAARVIARRGVRGLRMEELAAEARVSKALVYYHFGDRARLLHHTLGFIGDRAERYTGGAPAGPGVRAGEGPAREEPAREEPAREEPAREDRVRELERRLLRELQDVPEVRENSIAWGELRGGAVFEPELRDGLARAGRAWTREIAELLGRVVPAASGAALSAAAERLTVLVEGLSTRWLIGVLPVGHARELLRDAIGAEIEGLRTRRGGQVRTGTHSRPLCFD